MTGNAQRASPFAPVSWRSGDHRWRPSLRSPWCTVGGLLGAQSAIRACANGHAEQPALPRRDDHQWITSGDKVFSDFSYIVNTVVSPGMPTAAQVFVTPEIVAGNYGLLFNALWHANPGNGNETALLSYTVTITAPNTLRDRSYCVRYPDRSDEPGPEDSAVGTGSAFARSILNRS